MSTLTVQLPESVKKSIEELAAKEGYSVSQFLASAASEKLAVMLSMDYLRREAAAGRREDFEGYLASVPNVSPQPGDELPEDYTPMRRRAARQTAMAAEGWITQCG